MEYDFIPRFHGMIETNRGIGGIFDLVQDDDGQVSRTLGECLRDGTVTRERALWEQSLDQFLGRLMETGVILRDLNPGNLSARRLADGSIRLVAIDGIGHRDFIPLCDYIPWIARRKQARQISKKYMGSIESLLAHAERMEQKNAKP